MNFSSHKFTGCASGALPPPIFFKCIRGCVLLLFVMAASLFVRGAIKPLELVYENCTKAQEKYTQRVIEGGDYEFKGSGEKDQENGTLCLDCNADSVPGHSHYGPPGWSNNLKQVTRAMQVALPPNSSNIPEICFYAGMLRSPEVISRVYSCNSRNQMNPTRRKIPICIREDYVRKTAHAFNTMANCFDLSPKEKKNMFSTLNHESAFILNARSSTKARCYGQVTRDRLLDLNKYIYFSRHAPDPYWQPYHDIYTKASEKCPFMEDILVPSGLMDMGTEPTRRDREKNRTPHYSPKGLAAKVKKSAYTCPLVENPYSCLLYSIYNFKLNAADFDEQERYPPGTGAGDTPSKIREHFLISEEQGGRLRPNEILVVKGQTVTSQGVTNVEWLFSSENEIFELFEENKMPYDNLTVQRVPVFDGEEFRRHFIHTAHNGGPIVVKNRVEPFMNRVRNKIANGKVCVRDPACKRRREDLLAGKLLSTNDLRTLFEPFARSTIPNKEAAVFMAKADKHIENITDPGHISQYLRHSRFSKEDDGVAGKVRPISRAIQLQCSWIRGKK